VLVNADTDTWELRWVAPRFPGCFGAGALATKLGVPGSVVEECDVYLLTGPARVNLRTHPPAARTPRTGAPGHDGEETANLSLSAKPHRPGALPRAGSRIRSFGIESLNETDLRGLVRDLDLLTLGAPRNSLDFLHGLRPS
jgi:hypothetical protein